MLRAAPAFADPWMLSGILIDCVSILAAMKRECVRWEWCELSA